MNNRIKHDQSGSIALIIIVVVVVALVGGAGYMVWKNKSDKDDKKQTETTQQDQAKSAEAAKKAAEDKRIADAKAKLKLAASPFQSADLGEVYYPEGWKVVENPSDNVLLSMTSPTADKDTNNNEYTANALIAIEPQDVTDEAAYVSQLKTTNASLHKDYKITNERQVTAHDMTYKVIEAIFTEGSLKLKQMQAVVVQDGHAALFSATAFQQDWPIYQDIFEQVMTK